MNIVDVSAVKRRLAPWLNNRRRRIVGFALHSFYEHDGWTVWLNTEAGDFDGLCLATQCATEDEALSAAVAVLEALTAALQGEPAITVEADEHRA